MTDNALVRDVLKRLLPAPWYWRFLAWRIGYFDPEVRLLRYLCDQTKVSIDIGASIGSYTVHLLNHSRKCYAFDPRPDALAHLVKRLIARPDPRLCVQAVALSDRASEARLKVPLDQPGRSSIEQGNPVEQFGAVEEFTVPTRRLDDYNAIEPVGCIKIDVEGHEDAVLRGARGILMRDHPSLIIEIEERHKRRSVGSVTASLEELGYRGFFFRDGRLNPIESFDPEQHQDVSNIVDGINKDDRYVNNFLFFADESLARVRHLIARP